jgi:serine/threonine-protein kinase
MVGSPYPNEVEVAARSEARVGAWLKDKYRLDRILGIGGMAVVYAATHRNQAEFAVKVLHPELSMRREVRNRFLREGYAANSVRHAGAVRVVDDDIADDGAAFLVMELLQGEPVETLWERAGSRLSPKAVIGVGWQLLDVLTAAHEKSIVHRDIKPANVFVTTEGAVKVLDFGIARLCDVALSGSATQAGIMMGTPAFMAPEQAMAKAEAIDAQSDVWSAGATLFTLLSGQLVHGGDNSAQLLISAATVPAPPLSSVAPDVPPALANVIDRALAFDKAQRWPSAAAMREALREASLAMYGEGPSRRVLLGLLGLEARAVPSTERPPALSVVRPPPAELATSQPVASDRMPSGSPKRTKIGMIAAIAGGLTVLAIGLAAVALTRGHAHTDATAGLAPKTTDSASARSPAAPEPSASVEPLPSVVPMTAPSASPPVTNSPPASAHAIGPTPAAARVPSAHPVASSHSPAVGKAECATPYVLDANGNKKWKLQCLAH